MYDINDVVVVRGNIPPNSGRGRPLGRGGDRGRPLGGGGGVNNNRNNNINNIDNIDDIGGGRKQKFEAFSGDGHALNE